MRIVPLTILLVSILIATAVAKKEPKTYPEEGRVIGTGTTEHAHTSGSILGAPGGMTTGSVNSHSTFSHTYKVQTGTKIYELDCGKKAIFQGIHSTEPECLADGKPIKVGDVIHFRIEKDSAYIPQPNPDGTQSEEKLRILSEDEAPKENPSAAAAQVQPAAESTAAALLDIASTPPGADIEIDGKFVGSTPSSISIKPGDHDIAVKKTGFSAWQKKVSVAPGHINIAAELVAEPK